MSRAKLSFLFFVLLLFLACAHQREVRKSTEPSQNTTTVGNITLQNHQVVPIKYLLEHPEQKGLLLAHYLGTGKTFTALGFAEHVPEKSVYILAPKTLEGNWSSEMKKMGLKNPHRYHFISFEDAPKKLPHNLENDILIIDEVHHFIDFMKNKSRSERLLYVALYDRMRAAQRILALSGTPISNDISDIAYILNLVSGKELLPFNEREFLDNYTTINKGRSFWRGHLTESHLMIFGAPFVLAAVPLAFITPHIALVSSLYFGGLGAGFLAFPLINSNVPLSHYPLRRFDTEKLKLFCEKYISFFDFRIDSDTLADFPRKKISHRQVPYNDAQIEFFLNFADLSLAKDEVALLTREKNYHIDGQLFESTAIQKEIRSIPLSGREIGNFHFSNPDNNAIIESPKFLGIWDEINKNPHRIVVYSHYDENGLKLFEQFLKRKDFQGTIKTLSAELNPSEQNAIIAEYSQGSIDILLVDPVFSEGISLLRSSQLHILEEPGSEAGLEQIIGRTVRLNSHKGLPSQEQQVLVYVWESELSGLSAFLKKNNNWARRFSELNSVASFGTGQAEIDPNFFFKKISPDTLARKKSFYISNAMETLKGLLEKHSIETSSK